MAMIPLESQRAISIISHVDHGKSTLADRFLELTGAVDPRDMRAQYLDSMDLERERGITIKAQNVRLEWKDHTLHLIDTPGHVDFSYEVSRSLAACEGVILLVDASQGIEAQTLANCYLAMENDLTIVAALNKIDLPAAEPDKRAQEIERVLGIPADDVLRISAKTGEGVKELLDAIVERIPAPKGDASVLPAGAKLDRAFERIEIGRHLDRGIAVERRRGRNALVHIDRQIGLLDRFIKIRKRQQRQRMVRREMQRKLQIHETEIFTTTPTERRAEALDEVARSE